MGKIFASLRWYSENLRSISHFIINVMFSCPTEQVAVSIKKGFKMQIDFSHLRII